MYIVLEGIVGSGKTTQVKKLGEYFRVIYPDKHIVLVREPGTTTIAEDIRYLAQGKVWNDEVMHPLTNTYLYAAARAQTLHTILKPALDRGDIVISDRCFLSSCAIQGAAQGVGIDTVLYVNREAIRGVLPDRVIFLDIDIDTALGRIFDHSGDKFERESRDFYEKIIEGYALCEQIEIMKDRFIRVDANSTEDIVFERIRETLKI